MTKKTTAAAESSVTGIEKATPEVDKPVEKPVESEKANIASTRITPQMEFVAPSDLYLQLVEPRELKKGMKALCYLYVPMGWYQGYLNQEVSESKCGNAFKSHGAVALVEKAPLRNKDNLNVFRMKKGDVLSAVKGKGIFLKDSEGKTLSKMELDDLLPSDDESLTTVFSVKESKTEPVRVSLIPMSDVVKLKLKIKGFIKVFDGETFHGLNSNIVAPKEGVFAIVLTDKLPENYFKGKPNYTFTLNPGGRIEADTDSCCDIIRIVPSKSVLEEEIFANCL